ncbi:hypothetical protein [Sulfurimonas sp. HSL3-7]|jgi:hypothetical protein|uniref:hypothetical protein n=1 Tax=Sulfonitrofixus jiaomeiensis TaxID=3131938 RepID=UPI0031F87D6C
MKLLHLFLALLTATFFLACSSDKEILQVDTNLTAYSDDTVELHASGSKAYSWSQLSGTSVILVNANTSTASFIAPGVTTQESLVFELEAVTAQLETTNITVKKQVHVTVLPKVVEVNEADTTSPEVEQGATPSLKSLKLTVEKNSLNVDENTTLKVIATYQDNTTKDVTEEVEWNLSDTNAAQITQRSLHAMKDTNIILQAKLNTVTSNSLALEIYKEINGHKLPPEPDETINNSTLLGIDSNNNGVRDDVERWIFAEYDHPIVQAVAMQNARAFQIILVDPSKARETDKLMENQTDCQSYYMHQDSKKLIPRGKSLYKESRPLILNTRERNRAYYEYNQALSGGVYPGRDRNTHKTRCDFNETKILQGEWE